MFTQYLGLGIKNVGKRVILLLSGISFCMDVMSLSQLTFLGHHKILHKSQQLQNSTTYFPLLIESEHTGRQVSGSVLAYLDYPADKIKQKLLHQETWCYIVHLHPNIKACIRDHSNKMVRVFIGSKLSPKALQKQDFVFQWGPQEAKYFSVALTARNGPLQTQNYYIVLEGVAKGDKNTVLRLAYGYQYSRHAKLVQNLYFRTVGRHKIGFTTQKDLKGNKVPVKGLKAAVERNSMRYFLGLRTFFETGGEINDAYRYWYDLTSKYPQLYELPKQQYLNNKNKERNFQSLLYKKKSGEWKNKMPY